jgi:uncharacterized protein YkwD
VLVETAASNAPAHQLGNVRPCCPTVSGHSAVWLLSFINDETLRHFGQRRHWTTAVALDLNSFRAQHGLRPLSASGALAGAASSHAHNLAARQRLDHTGFRQRVSVANGTAAENVAFGCATEDCVIRMWSRSSRHRANMLRRDVTLYGLASADGGNGRRYWVLELGN